MHMQDGRIRQFIVLATALIAFGACSALSPEDPAATLRAEREGYIAEATLIADSAMMQQTQIIETVVAAETSVSQAEARNALLLATLRVALPPTQQIVSASGVVTPGQVATPAAPGSVPNATIQVGGATTAGGTTFVDVATALTVRDADGCADVLETAFPANIGRIYVTARALNITAGTVMRVEWMYEGQSAFSESFTVSDNDDDFCLWFYIEPSELILSPGSWSVQLYANDQAIQPSIAFTIAGDEMIG